MAATAFRPTDRTPDRAAAPGGLFDASADQVELSDVLAQLRRQWLTILVCTLLFLGAGFAYATFADKIYTGATRVLLDPRDKRIVGTDVVQPTQGTDAGWIETQVDLVTASATLRKVIDREHLIDDPEFGGTGNASDADAVLRSFAEHVRAERSADTFVIDIIVSSMSAEKAARLSMAVAEAFIESSTEAKQSTARQANALLLKQIDELKALARDADQRVEAYRQSHGMVDVDGRPLDEQTLKQLNEAYIAAKLKADSAAERQRTLAAIMRSGADGLASALDTIDSPVLGRLKLEYALALKQQAELGQTLGNRHPKMAALDADIARTRSLIMQELRNLADKARVDADLATAQAASTAAAMADAKRRVSDTSEASVALRDLESEAGMRRDVYKAFVARAQETGLLENLQVSDARIVSPAQVPLVPTAPKKKIILGLALIGGLGVGLSLALYRGRARILAMRAKAEAAQNAAAAAPPLAPAAAEGDDILAEFAMPVGLVEGDGLPEGVAAEAMRAFADQAADALAQLAGVLTRPDQTEGPAVHVVFGTAASGAIAAVTFGLARAMAEGGVQTLLLDANDGPVTVGEAFIDGAAHGIVDVEVDDADPAAIGTTIPGTTIVLLPAASGALRHRIAGYGARIVETIDDVADGFQHVLVDLGPSCPPALFRSLAEIADDIVMVVDAAEANAPEIVAMFADLRDLVPELRGIVAARALPAGTTVARDAVPV
ncbi:Wzz/FepE/Etk N-terminal domain-containing protein [Kaistia dalseonensis]|uniref:Uncharacterized protein involved in exopolysaccharide biosynthesis n=1 Tax=Kaistia dalseonensis TaxID=410840 RepID=A0ABU0H9Y6_9HYPH|nr:Wzz/FepE/Etk N-terminal domain-containing protein [Kaistia dalseonensis]MCX5495977.1 Wzz/FepE/Etk N-terminal domain-containing protein [Kaistia dalseonensis]MDQ0438580.1 uncharacterized protein involved in exopolysaccharide biosynthesis [Kaistia dalseonensis]